MNKKFDFTTADALHNTRDAVLRFPLGHTLKWSLVALAVPAVFMLGMAVLCQIIGGDARAVFDPEVVDVCWTVLIVSQAGVVVFWLVRHLRSVAA